MQCPRSDGELEEVEIGGVTVDICKSCGGVWFETRELEKFDEVHEEAGQKLQDLMAKYHADNIDHEKNLNNPRHPEIELTRRYYSPKQEIEIDECPVTGGIWLDAGELAKIREMFPTEAHRKKAYRDFAIRFKQSADIEKMKRESTGGARKTQRVINLMEWLFG